MRILWAPLVLAAGFLLAPSAASAWADPETTVRMADEILRESMSMPVRRIPESLLAEAQGVAIIPNVIKIGFVAAVRRGHGVLLVRDPNGAWSLPQFITLTGGSVGWQAGIQGTDVILVFMTRKSVEGLLNGKFTIGADASVAAGPVGRNAAAATDWRLKAEILSYSRSRGLYLGVALDGSVIDTDPVAQSLYYGTAVGQAPQQVPASATQLIQNLVLATEARATPPPEAAGVPGAATPDVRQQLATSANSLYGILDQQWRAFLALPPAVFDAGSAPRLDALQGSLAQFDRVVQSAQYDTLVARPEFQNTYGLLRDYVTQLSRPTEPVVQLPPPPAK